MPLTPQLLLTASNSRVCSHLVRNTIKVARAFQTLVVPTRLSRSSWFISPTWECHSLALNPTKWRQTPTATLCHQTWCRHRSTHRWISPTTRRDSVPIDWLARRIRWGWTLMRIRQVIKNSCYTNLRVACWQSGLLKIQDHKLKWVWWCSRRVKLSK